MGFLDYEFTAGGLFLFLAAFMFLIIPFVLWFLEDQAARRRNHLPEASLDIPIPPPTRIKELRIYPIKSCRGISVTEARILKTGLDLDRQWMFVDAENFSFLTIRQITEMTLIDTELTSDDKLVVSIRNGKPEVKITIPTRPSKDWFEENTELRQVEIWGQKVDGWVYPSELTRGFSAFFGKEVRLVYKGPTPRILRGNGAPKILGRTQSINFADFMPVQVSNAKSIQELNTRLKQSGEEPITIERFRPNIVIEGDEPWYEDKWKTVRIGDSEKETVTMDVVAHCARCLVPNVDPNTAEKHKKQPWDTLMKYRRVDKNITFKPCFGMLCVPREEAKVSVGSTFAITEVTTKHGEIKEL